MEAFSSTTTTSSSSSSASLYLAQYSQDPKGSRLQPSFHSSLHSVRKPQMKPWKKPIAPLPPTPPKVYKVDPVNFRELVQKLTGASTDFSQPQQRLQSVAPPPLDLARSPVLFGKDIEAPLQLLPSPAKTPLSAFYQELMSEALDANAKRISDSAMASSTLELNLASPSAWCSFPLLSPGTLTSLEQSTVL